MDRNENIFTVIWGVILFILGVAIAYSNILKKRTDLFLDDILINGFICTFLVLGGIGCVVKGFKIKISYNKNLLIFIIKVMTFLTTVILPLILIIISLNQILFNNQIRIKYLIMDFSYYNLIQLSYFVLAIGITTSGYFILKKEKHKKLSEKISASMIAIYLIFLAISIFINLMKAPSSNENFDLDLGILIVRGGFIRFIILVFNIILLIYLSSFLFKKFKTIKSWSSVKLWIKDFWNNW